MLSSGALEAGDRPSFVEGWFDINSLPASLDLANLTVQSLCRILDLSHQAGNRLGESYRGFKVGTAALVVDTPGGRIATYFAGNLTPYEGADWGCAEKRVSETIPWRGFDRVLAIAVTGPPQTDASGVESLTLHPCYKCRSMMSGSELFTADTLIATSNLTQDVYELFTLQSLLKLHETKQPQPFPNFHPLLPHYWRQILEFDPADEIRERAILQSMAAIIRKQ